MKLHHVGIVCPDASLMDSLRALAGDAGDERSRGIQFCHVPEFQCDCYLVGQIELVVPNGERMEGTPLHRWLLSRGRSIHHIAFEVADLEAVCDRLREASIPIVLDSPVAGVGALRVNFVHPSHCGFLVELVEQE